MNEELTSITEDNTINPESDQQPEVTSSPSTVQPPTAENRNWLQLAAIILLLLPLNYFVYQTIKTSAKTGDNGNASSSDGIANLLNGTQSNPSYDSYLSLGVAYYNEHRFQDAIDAWQKGLTYSPNSHILYSNIGAAYNCLSKWQEGKANCEKALAINPSFALAQNNLKWAVNELAKSGTPVTPSAAANASGPAGAAPYDAAKFNTLLDKGLGYYNQKNYTAAVEVWKQALAVNPNSEVVYSNMGAAYGCLNMWREQVAACEKALAINPNYQLAANNLAWGRSELTKRGMKP